MPACRNFPDALPSLARLTLPTPPNVPVLPAQLVVSKVAGKLDMVPSRILGTFPVAMKTKQAVRRRNCALGAINRSAELRPATLILEKAKPYERRGKAALQKQVARPGLQGGRLRGDGARIVSTSAMRRAFTRLRALLLSWKQARQDGSFSGWRPGASQRARRGLVGVNGRRFPSIHNIRRHCL